MTAIEDKYAAVNGATLLGAPTSVEAPTSDGVGRFRHYQLGSIYWHPMSGACEVHGDIAAKWQATGWENGFLGYPLTDESGAGAIGRFNHFMNGSIYWTPQHGAHPLARTVTEKWQTMGWESSIGFPTGDPVDLGDGELHQVFERAIVSWGPQRGVRVINRPDAAAESKFARVFLVSWADLLPPPGYTTEFFTKYYFGVGESFVNPDGNVIPGSVADYYSHVSDGNLSLTGRVENWVHSSLNVTDVPHYFDGVRYPAGRARLMSAAVTESLRGFGIRTRDQLSVDGRMPDVLVFQCLDVWAGGGSTRTLWDVRTELQDAGRLDLWDRAWEVLADIPIVLVSACSQNPPPANRADGTFTERPDVTRLRWAGWSAVFHEFVHAILGMGYDIYGGPWQFSTWFELMSFSWPTDYPVLMTSYVQERCGFLTIEDLPRRSHRSLVLDPLDTHSTAFRLQNGPLSNAEALVFENRSRWDYSQNPPPRLSNILLAYTIDAQSRRIQSDGRRLTGRVITHPGGFWNECWGIPGALDLAGTGPALGNSLNYLGEKWWELRNIDVDADSTIILDVDYQPLDLIRGYLTAIWTNGAGEPLTPDAFAGPRGHVMLVGRSRPIEAGQRYDKVLSLHPNWVPNGEVRGRYQVAVPSSGARLYVTCALSEAALGSDGVICTILVQGGVALTQSLTLERNIRTLVVDLAAHRGQTIELGITINAGQNATRDWAHILEAVVVPTAEPITDFLQEMTLGSYRSNVGPIGINGGGGLNGSATTVGQVAMENGQIYAGPILKLFPDSNNDGFLEASFPFTVPAGNAVLRAEMGFDESRFVTDNGVQVSASFFDQSEVQTALVTSSTVSRAPAVGERGLSANPLLALAAVFPDALHGQRGRVVLRIDADGSPAQDDVYWTMARVTMD